MVPSLVLFLLVGGLVWASDEKPSPPSVVVENPTAETLRADIVWRAPGGAVFGTLVHVVAAGSSLAFPPRAATEGCVRWIQDDTVRAAWPVAPEAEEGGPPVRLDDGHGSTPSVAGSCASELVEHRVRPVLGRWLLPHQPDRVYRERLITRSLPRRGWQAEERQRRNRGLWGQREDDRDGAYAISSRSGRRR